MKKSSKKNNDIKEKKLLYQERINYNDPQITRSFCMRESTAKKIDELMERLNISKSELLRQAVTLLYGVVEGSRDLEKATNSIKVQRSIEVIKNALIGNVDIDE